MMLMAFSGLVEKTSIVLWIGVLSLSSVLEGLAPLCKS